MRTSIDIPDALLQELRELSARERCSLRSVVASALRAYIASERSERKDFKLADGSYRGQGVAPGVREGDWNRIRALTYEGHGD